MAKIKQGLYNIIEEPFYPGKDVYIGNYVHIRPNVAIGDNSEIRDYCFIGSNVLIKENSRIYQYCNIGTGTKIGNNCFIGLGVVTLNDKEIMYPEKDNWVSNPPIIEDKVKIGAKAIIMPGIRLAHHSRIGAGAVVTKDTEPYKTYKGVPARNV